MALQNGFPGHTALASFADLRRDLEGTVARSAAGVLRAGVFPDHLDPLVTGRTDMKVNIADFRAVQNRGGAIFLANVGVDSSVTLDAAPASNKRLDLIYVYQQSVTLGDADSTPVFGVVKGTASATPTVPPLPAGVSTAIPLATVEIPAGATTTLSAGVVFTQVYPYTAMAGGTVTVRNSVELTDWVPPVGGKAYNLADGTEYTRISGGWEQGTTPWVEVMTQNGSEPRAAYRLNRGLLEVEGIGSKPGSTYNCFTLPVGFRPSRTRTFLDYINSGQQVQVTSAGLVSHSNINATVIGFDFRFRPVGA